MTDIRSQFKLKCSYKPWHTKLSISTASNGLIASAVEFDVIIRDPVRNIELCRIAGYSIYCQVTAFHLLDDAQIVFVAYSDGNIVAYSVPDGNKCWSAGKQKHHVSCMKADNTRSLLATGSLDGIIRVWDIEKGYLTHTFSGHAHAVNALDFYCDITKDQFMLASGSMDTTVRIWDLKIKKSHSVLKHHASAVMDVAFSSDGNLLISGGQDQIVSVWDTKRKVSADALKNTYVIGYTIRSLGFIPAENKILPGEQLFYTAADFEGEFFKIFNIEGKEILKSPQPSFTSQGHIHQVIYEPKLSKFFTNSSDMTVSIYESAENHLQLVWQEPGELKEITDAQFLLNKAVAVSHFSFSNDILILDETQGTIARLQGHEDTVIALDTDLAKTYLVSGSKDQTAILWKLDQDNLSFTKVLHLKGHTSSITAVSISKYSANTEPEFILTAAADRTLKKWNVSSNLSRNTQLKAQYTKVPHAKDVNAIDIAPNNESFATGSQDKTIKIWNSDTCEELATLTGHRRGVYCIQYSWTEKKLASGSSDMTVKLWSLEDYSCLNTFEGHSNSVLKVCWISKCQQIVSAGADGLVKLWSLSDKDKTATTIDAHSDRIWALSSFEDGSYLVTGSSDSVLNIWEDQTEEVKQVARVQAQEKAIKEQKLANLMFNKDWKEAILLAIEMNRPLQLLSIFKAFLSSFSFVDNSEADLAERGIDDILEFLNMDQISLLLKRMREWNTSVHSFSIVQILLDRMLKKYSFDELKHIPSFNDYIRVIQAYNEKHEERLDRYIRECWLLEYISHEQAKHKIS